MTTEQLNQLKEMTRGEIARKYTPLLLRGEITKEVYDKVISLGKSNPDGDEPEGPKGPQEPEGRPDPQGPSNRVLRTVGGPEPTRSSSPMSQKQRVLSVLSDGAWHSTVAIMLTAYGLEDKQGICRIAARIHELRKEGHPIEGKKLKDGVWQYQLKPEPVFSAARAFNPLNPVGTVSNADLRAENISPMPSFTTA